MGVLVIRKFVANLGHWFDSVFTPHVACREMAIIEKKRKAEAAGATLSETVAAFPGSKWKAREWLRDDPVSLLDSDFFWARRPRQFGGRGRAVVRRGGRRRRFAEVKDGAEVKDDGEVKDTAEVQNAGEVKDGEEAKNAGQVNQVKKLRMAGK
jgi:hypothetical protein